jgi:hypothetical protein
MSLFYVVGGPRPGERDAFFRRLDEIGGTPPRWTLYRHADGDGQALHIVEAPSADAVLAHLAALGPIYVHGPVIEIVPLSTEPRRD